VFLFFSGKTTWKYVTHEPPLLPGKVTCQFICSCVHAVTLETPTIYDMTSDPGETTPINLSLERYRTLSNTFNKAIQQHVNSLETVDSQFSWSKLLPHFNWQPCCNGTFPFNCNCEDSKFSS